MRSIRLSVFAGLAALAISGFASAHAAPAFSDPWPADPQTDGQAAEIASYSPFVPGDIGSDAPGAKARISYYAPRGASAARRAPAVVLLHGAGGVLQAREATYAAQLAEMGIGAVVVDVFGARRDLATGFIDRVIEITETMALADAYAALGWLQQREEIDSTRVALWGFSYGAMAGVYAANAAVADRLAALYGLGGTRFAAHVAFYGPCITSFDAPKTTGAPVLLAWGEGDELIDPQRCAELVGELRDGGSTVETVSYPGAYHQWDGGWGGPRRIGRTLADCRFRVSRDLTVRATLLGIPMSDPLTRKTMLALCVGSEGYLMGRDDAVRAESNRAVARFLSRVFGLDRRG